MACVVALIGSMVGCGPSSSRLEPAEETTGEVASEAASDTSTSAQDQRVSSSEGDESTSDPPSSFIESYDWGNAFECDMWIQDCPAGSKCSFWANDGGSSWNATKCVPIVPDPDQAGEPCTVETNIWSGLDSCMLGALCWNVDPQTNTGVCVEYCQGDQHDPTCSNPDLRCGGSRDLPLCLPTCCPVEQDCPDGQACYPFVEGFHCVLDASGEQGAFGDPCEFVNACDPGLFCVKADVVPDCDGSVGCCTHYCVLGSSTCSTLHPGMDCVPWHEDGNAPPGEELVGVCVIPA